jgi:hypothetical protein
MTTYTYKTVYSFGEYLKCEEEGWSLISKNSIVTGSYILQKAN